MGLFGLFKSKEEKKALKIKKEVIGDSVTCSLCGKTFYELKTERIPYELSQKYYFDSVSQCTRCGRFYCRGGYDIVCAMRGCLCGGRDYIVPKFLN